ncbi:MAG: hypothetical protein JJE21_10100 [Spirochaetaceae bacterium]|nr:hypothetical protein [Spirochaetaceae bacterium]
MLLFSLIYNERSLSDGNILNEESYDLSKVFKTDNFIIRRSAGNLNKTLGLMIFVTTSSFVVEFNGNDNDNYDTGLIPKVYLTSTDDAFYYQINYKRTSSNLYSYINAGANEESANLAAFYLKINVHNLSSLRVFLRIDILH